MWFFIVTTVYTGFSPHVDLEPGTVLRSHLIQGYETQEACETEARTAPDSDLTGAERMMYPTADITVIRNCFEGDPRLWKHTLLGKNGITAD